MADILKELGAIALTIIGVFVGLFLFNKKLSKKSDKKIQEDINEEIKDLNARPAADIISSLPNADAVRDRLDEIDRKSAGSAASGSTTDAGGEALNQGGNRLDNSTRDLLKRFSRRSDLEPVPNSTEGKSDN